MADIKHDPAPKVAPQERASIEKSMGVYYYWYTFGKAMEAWGEDRFFDLKNVKEAHVYRELMAKWLSTSEEIRILHELPRPLPEMSIQEIIRLRLMEAHLRLTEAKRSRTRMSVTQGALEPRESLETSENRTREAENERDRLRVENELLKTRISEERRRGLFRKRGATRSRSR